MDRLTLSRPAPLRAAGQSRNSGRWTRFEQTRGRRLAVLLVAGVFAACSDRSPTDPPLDEAPVASQETDAEPGTNPEGILQDVTLGSLVPVVSETGLISLSVDGVGSNSGTGIVEVDKPTGATVRSAYLAAASSPFTAGIPDGNVQLDGTPLSWGVSTPQSFVVGQNHWVEVTALVKPKVDAAAAGRVGFTVTEINPLQIEGTILAVIFDDPAQTTTNTAVLAFGAQDVNGDNFFVSLAEPIDTSDPTLRLDMGLGISFGFQPSSQFSLVDVNGSRVTSCAGGHDDAQPVTPQNGLLLTVGGLDDSNANPASDCSGISGPFVDDELYSLVPFVSDGDTQINVFTRNPSNDDNLFFASFFLTVEADVTPDPDPNNRPVVDADAASVIIDEGQTASTTGTYSDADGDPVSLTASIGSITDNGDGTWSWAWDTSDGPAETQTVTVTADDGEAAVDATFELTVVNVAPTILAVTVPSDPVSVGTAVSVVAPFDDPAQGLDDEYLCSIDFGPVTQGSSVMYGDSCESAHAYTSAGIYAVTVTVTDKDGGSHTRTAEMRIVVYDPDGGFVTGGGWIESGEGAYRPDPDLVGKATFGFVSKYQKGRTVPNGNAEFQFRAGDLNFHSDSYEWLVVTQGGRAAQLKGTGTVNGAPDANGNPFGFLIWAGDDEADTFRVRIWSELADGTEVTIYDNGFDQELAGGSIVIHTKGG